MTIHKTRAAVAAAMLVGMAVLAGCGDSKDEVQPQTPPVAVPVVTPSATATPSTAPSGSPTPSGSADANAPQFLAATDLPKGDRYGTWKPEGIEEGLPDPEYYCIKDKLPVDDTEYQTYQSDLEAQARQFLVETESEADAQKLVTELNTALDGCLESYKKENADDPATEQTYPDHAGAKLRGYFFAPKDSEYHAQLFAVGSSGSTVTVVVLGQGGKADEAALDAFKDMVSAAMDKLG